MTVVQALLYGSEVGVWGPACLACAGAVVPDPRCVCFCFCVAPQWWKAVLEPKWLRRQVRGDPGCPFVHASGRTTAPSALRCRRSFFLYVAVLAVARSRRFFFFLCASGPHDGAMYVAFLGPCTLRDARQHQVRGILGCLCTLRDARRLQVRGILGCLCMIWDPQRCQVRGGPAALVHFVTHDGAMYVAVQAAFLLVRAGPGCLYTRTHDGAKYVRSSSWLPLPRLASSRGGAGLGFFVLPVWAPMLLDVT